MQSRFFYDTQEKNFNHSLTLNNIRTSIREICFETPHCLHIHNFPKKMDSFLAIVYYDGHMATTSKGILFKCPYGQNCIG